MIIINFFISIIVTLSVNTISVPMLSIGALLLLHTHYFTQQFDVARHAPDTCLLHRSNIYLLIRKPKKKKSPISCDWASLAHEATYLEMRMNWAIFILGHQDSFYICAGFFYLFISFFKFSFISIGCDSRESKKCRGQSVIT